MDQALDGQVAVHSVLESGAVDDTAGVRIDASDDDAVVDHLNVAVSQVRGAEAAWGGTYLLEGVKDYAVGDGSAIHTTAIPSLVLAKACRNADGIHGARDGVHLHESPLGVVDITVEESRRQSEQTPIGVLDHDERGRERKAEVKLRWVLRTT